MAFFRLRSEVEFADIYVMVYETKLPNTASHTGTFRRPGTDPTLPSVVMLHGLFGKLTNFEPVLPHLAPQVDVWIPELPLYTVIEGTDSIEGLSNWLNHWLEINEIESAVLLGNSLGGHIALDCAIRGNSSIQGLVLVGSSGLFDAGFGDSIPRRFDRMYIHEKASEAFHNYDVDADMVEEIHDVITNRQMLGKLVRLARSARHANTEPQLSGVSVPTCIIWGENDRITPPSVAQKFHHLISDSELHWIPNCGHVPMLEQPSAFAHILNKFILGYNHPSHTIIQSVQSTLS
jgi:2-hydroxy-6-oxonona-2,4-dienedioate hydrolase